VDTKLVAEGKFEKNYYSDFSSADSDGLFVILAWRLLMNGNEEIDYLVSDFISIFPSKRSASHALITQLTTGIVEKFHRCDADDI
jgi:hypothetical protein